MCFFFSENSFDEMHEDACVTLTGKEVFTFRLRHIPKSGVFLSWKKSDIEDMVRQIEVKNLL